MQINVAKDVSTEIQEVLIATKDERLRIVDVTQHHGINPSDLSHAVLRVSLDSCKDYCLDLAGGQFRWYICPALQKAVRALLNHSLFKGLK